MILLSPNPFDKNSDEMPFTDFPKGFRGKALLAPGGTLLIRGNTEEQSSAPQEKDSKSSSPATAKKVLLNSLRKGNPISSCRISGSGIAMDGTKFRIDGSL
jgi:hypothetical protein